MSRHIRNYAAVKKAMKGYFDREAQKAARDYKAKAAVCSTKIDEESLERLLEWRDKGLPRWRAKWEARLEAADEAPRLLEIDISVHWAKNRSWGWNPHAEAWVCFADKQYGSRSAYGEGSASGCGYDKRSTAIDEALGMPVKKRDNAEQRSEKLLARSAIDRFVIEHGEELWKEYAIDRTPFPHFSFGGKGASTFTRLFRRAGCLGRWGDAPVKDYLIDYRETDARDDVYHIYATRR